LAAVCPARADDSIVTAGIPGAQRSPVGVVDPADSLHAVIVYENLGSNGISCGFSVTLNGGQSFTRGVMTRAGSAFGEFPSVQMLDGGTALMTCNYLDAMGVNTAITGYLLQKGANTLSAPIDIVSGSFAGPQAFTGGGLSKNYGFNNGLAKVAALSYFAFTVADGSSSLLSKTSTDGGLTWSAPALIAGNLGVAYRPASAFNSSGGYLAYVNSTATGAFLVGSWGRFNPNGSLIFGSPTIVRPITLPTGGAYPGFPFDASNRPTVVPVGSTNWVVGYTDQDTANGFSVKAILSTNWGPFGNPVIINDGRLGPTRSAFFADFSLNKNGDIKTVFLDNRLGVVGNLLNVWGSLSSDGVSWGPNFQENTLSIDPNGLGNGGLNLGSGISVDATGSTFGRKYWPLSLDLDFSHVYTDGPRTGIPAFGATAPLTRMANLRSFTFGLDTSPPAWNTVTVFATVINAGAATATGVSIAPLTAIPATFAYQTTDPLTNQVTGMPNTPVDIPAGMSQSFVLAFTPTAAFLPTDVALNVAGANTAQVGTIFGVNTLVLAASTTPVPDIVALVGTTTNDGTVHIPGAGQSAAFVLAAVNLGASGPITISANTGGANLPLQINVCQTNPATSQCINPVVPAPSVTLQINNGQTPTFAFFVTATGPIAFSPAVNRIFVSAIDATQVLRGSSGVAVTTSQ
jgi:hypothetical protein